MLLDRSAHPTIRQRFRAFIGDRSLEWLSSVAMLWWGICLALPGDSLADPSLSAFHRYGMTETAWSLIFGGAGAAGIVALYINGRDKFKTPVVRMLRALFGAASWAQIAVLLIEGTALRDGVFPPASGIYAILACADLASIFRAAFDARYCDR